MAHRGRAAGMRDGYLRGELPRTRTARQVDILAAFVAAGGSVSGAAARVGVRPSTAKRHLADLGARSGLTTVQPIYRGRAEGWPLVVSLEAGAACRRTRFGRSSSPFASTRSTSTSFATIARTWPP